MLTRKGAILVITGAPGKSPGAGNATKATTPVATMSDGNDAKQRSDDDEDLDHDKKTTTILLLAESGALLYPPGDDAEQGTPPPER